MGVSCSTHEGNEKYSQNFGWKPEGKCPFGRPMRRWEDNIRMNLQERRWEVVA